MNLFKQGYIFGGIDILTAFFMLFIITEIPKIQNELKNNVQEDMVRTISSILNNFQNQLVTISKKNPSRSLKEILENNPSIRNELENQLSLVAAEDIKYIYVLYKDEKGKFRFMLDGATEGRTEFGRKFDIENDGWEISYKTQEPLLITQKELSLWITYLQPIVIDGNIEGIIAADFSLDGHKHILDIVAPLEKYVWIFMIIMLIGILVSVSQYILYQLSQRRVYIDPLTGLNNRNFLNDFIKTFNFQKYAIAMLDLDHFKLINDTYGHEAGDLVLIEIASTLKKSIREYDHLIRYGGEEFILFIAMRDSDQYSLMEMMERIRINVESLSIQIESVIVRPTISIGLNPYTDYFKNEFDAISIADKMLYNAKHKGRNRVISYSPEMDSDGLLSNQLNIHEVKVALEENRIFCEYQPIVDMQKHEIAGYEALVRIRSKDGAVIYPGMFLPNILKSNVYKQLTKTVLQICFETAMTHHVHVSVNLNVTDILDDDIYSLITDFLTQNTEHASLMTFELLEEEKITGIDILQNRTHTFQKLGAHVSIDDFGSGYSNFSHLFSFAIDVIKIDGSLIRNIDTSPIAKKLVQSIVAFAQTSNKKVIAEFVHSKTVMEIVKEAGVIYGQGYYFAKPSENLAKFIEQK